MIELIRNCSHGSEIATYRVCGNGSVSHLVKAAATPAGIKDLQCEIEGWKWYGALRYPENRKGLCQIVRQTENYLKIKIAFINGRKPNYTNGLRKNCEVVNKVIEQYCTLWPYNEQGLSVLHGDLSLDNIICNQDGIHIVDWEHFRPRGAPWGFDAMYLLFETLYFGMKNRAYPFRGETEFIGAQISALNAVQPLDSSALEQPLKFLRSFIAANASLWNEQLKVFPKKLPILLFTDEQTVAIDRMVSAKVKALA